MKPHRSLSVPLLSAVLLGLFLAACGPASPTPEPTPAGPTPVDQPTPSPEGERPGAFTLASLAALQPGDVLLQKDYEPTFFRIETMVPYGRVPSFTLYADGTLIYRLEGQSFEDEVMVAVQLTQEESVDLLNQALDLGLPRLESHTDFCENPGGQGMCVMDASYTILRGRLPSGQLHEVKIYADFANDPAAYEGIGDLLEGYQHPEAGPYQPQAATLFISPRTGAEGVVYEWPFGPELLQNASQERPWATYLEGAELAEFMEPLPRNVGDFLFESNGRPFNVYLVPWLPYADFRAAIQADFPAPSPGESETGAFSACPIPETGDVEPFGQLRLVYAEAGQLLLWDEVREPLVLAEAGDIEQVRLSPDGETAVYVTQPGGGAVQLWAISLGDGRAPGEPRPLAADGQLTGRLALDDFSPDGQRVADQLVADQLVAFTHQVKPGNAELWAARLDGGGSRRLVSVDELRAQFTVDPEPQGLVPFGLNWIPGTERLVYGAFPTYDEGIFIYVPDQVYQVDAGTGRGSVLFPAGTGGELVFAPDGKSLAILRLDSLSLYDLEAGGRPAPVDLLYHAIGFGEYYFYPPVWWAPDSSRLLVALPQDREYTPSVPISLWEVPADGSEPAELAEFTGFAPSFKVSPDLSRLAYWNAPPESNDRELHLANVDGSEDVLYTTGFLVDLLEWAPDSQRFVYTTGGSEDARTLLGDICAGPVELADFLAYPYWLGGGRMLLTGDRDGALQVAEANYAGEFTLLFTPESTDSYAFAVLPGE
ncbi:MAG TPA: hypothetical protein VGA03_13675 [Anaerolineales bacterium]